MTKAKLLLLAGLLAILALAPFAFPWLVSAFSSEKILRFQSDITVQPDRSLTVTETITVHSAGDQIKRGIYRDFPTEYRDRDGRLTSVAFQVLGVLRDGKPEPYRVTSLGNGKRIYIGQENVFLPAGIYTYTVAYRTDRQLGAFADHTELYWNVTGNGWAFPIDAASAVIRLPTRASPEAVALDGYTGQQGARGRDVEWFVDPSGLILFRTTRPLPPSEGLTIVAAWPRAAAPPSTPDAAARAFIRDNPAQAVGLLGLAALGLYYFAIWLIVGKDPARGAIAPLYAPPDGLSPAAMRYLSRMGFDHKAFAAAIIDLAARGYLTITQLGGLYSLRRTDRAPRDLPPEEQQIADRLFGADDEVTFLRTEHQRISGALRAFQQSLADRLASGYFHTNTRYFCLGYALSAAVVLAVALLSSESPSQWPAEYLMVWFAMFVLFMPAGLAVLVALAIAGLSRLRTLLLGGPRRAAALFEGPLLSLFALILLGLACFGLSVLGSATSPWATATWCALAYLNVLFSQLLKAPSVAGRKLLDRIEGFKMYLAVAEKDRLNLLNPPERTPELFEQYLPYALALDVEQAWAEQFADVLGRSANGQGSYSPYWYSGNGWDGSDPSGFVTSCGSAFSSAIASASTPPGSSSGGDGGGSSGGGGGGGGGGGW